MGLNYDLGEKSENFWRMNHFKIFNKTNRNFCWQKMLDFSRILALQIVDNLIWYGTLCICYLSLVLSDFNHVVCYGSNLRLFLCGPGHPPPEILRQKNFPIWSIVCVSLFRVIWLFTGIMILDIYWSISTTKKIFY